MASSINTNTDFTNLTITNDYPCLVGGTWTASLVDGVTVYTNGTTTYTGPVNLINATLNIQSGAVVDGIVSIGTGSTINVQNGGTLENSDIINGYLNISNGGVSQGNTYVSEWISISSGGSSINDIFYNPDSTSSTSGTLNLSQLPSSQSTSFQTSDGNGKLEPSGSNTTIINPQIYDNNVTRGGYYTVALGNNSQFGDTDAATNQDSSQYNTSYAFTLSNDYVTYLGGTWTASVNADGVTVYTGTSVTSGPGVVSGTVTITATNVNLINISSLTIKAGAVADGLTVTGSNNPSVYNYGTLENSFISNGYVYNYGTTDSNTFISDYYYEYSGATSKNDYYYEGGSAIYANYNLTNNTVTLPTFLLSDGGALINIYAGSTFDGSYAATGSRGTMAIYPYYRTTVLACFLAGTMINTPNGLIVVEDIKIGDYIITYNDDKQENRKVIWTGYNTTTINASLPEDEANYSIRILKNAISENVPYKDLWVTQEHCILFDNQFIPVRMLVNGTTIFYDHTITEYTYYHIETEIHSVIMADGVLTESYLDTGNRSSFISDTNIISIVNKNKEWNKDSAAPLITTRNVVEPIFYKLVERAQDLGFKYSPKEVEKTTDYGLYLLTDHGQTINVSSQNGKHFIFRIAGDVKNVRLISHTYQPSKTIGVYVDDRRHLGVLVGNITLLERHQTCHINSHLTSPTLAGWDVQENSPCRWTNGNALLHIRDDISETAGILVVYILDGGPYILEKTHHIKSNVNAIIA